jgi:hypothetical protein
MATRKKVAATAEGPVSYGGESALAHSQPYLVSVTLTGTVDLLFHAWNSEAIAAKAAAAKGSAAKKTDDPETLVYRNSAQELCIPGTYLWGAVIHAAKYRQDPRSPRKSAQDLYKAGVAVLTPLASLGTAEWDYLHKARVIIQRSAVTRTRPAILAGWTADFELLVNLPEYIDGPTLHAVLNDAGRLVGLADFRPTYGRFNVTHFSLLK